jgi:hypothetical protein
MKHWFRVTFNNRAVWVYCTQEARFGVAYQQAKQMGLA